MRTLAIFLMCCGCLWSQSAKPDELLVAARQVIGSGNYGRALVLVVMASQSLLKGTTSALSPTRIRAAMAGVMKLNVPLKIDVKSGPNWGACEVW